MGLKFDLIMGEIVDEAYQSSKPMRTLLFNRSIYKKAFSQKRNLTTKGMYEEEIKKWENTSDEELKFERAKSRIMQVQMRNLPWTTSLALALSMAAFVITVLSVYSDRLMPEIFSIEIVVITLVVLELMLGVVCLMFLSAKYFYNRFCILYHEFRLCCIDEVIKEREKLLKSL